MATVYYNTNERVAHLPGVKAAVYTEAEQIAGRARGKLAQHHYRGQAQIEVTQGELDSYVSLVDPAAMSIEFGHFHNFSGEFVLGLYIVTGAAGII